MAQKSVCYPALATLSLICEAGLLIGYNKEELDLHD